MGPRITGSDDFDVLVGVEVAVGGRANGPIALEIHQAGKHPRDRALLVDELRPK